MTDEEQVAAEIAQEKADPNSLLKSVDYIYTNASRITGNNFDVRIAFGERIFDEVKPRVGVAMSLHHFKAFVQALNDQLKRVEGLFGTIEYKTLKERAEEHHEG